MNSLDKTKIEPYQKFNNFRLIMKKDEDDSLEICNLADDDRIRRCRTEDGVFVYDLDVNNEISVDFSDYYTPYFFVKCEIVDDLYITKNVREIYISDLSFEKSAKGHAHYNDGKPISIRSSEKIEKSPISNVEFSGYKLNLG